MNSLNIECAGEVLKLLPSMVALWPKEQALFVADIHLGKRASRANRGLYLPEGSDTDDLASVKKICEEIEARSIFILGDLFQDSFSLNEESIQEFNKWIKSLGARVHLILGNHDVKATRHLASLKLEILPSGSPLGPFWLSHEPDNAGDGFNICGHLHPGIRMKDAAGCAHKAKAFWWSKDKLVLPAFGTTTSMSSVETKPGDVLYVCAEDKISELKI